MASRSLALTGVAWRQEEASLSLWICRTVSIPLCYSHQSDGGDNGPFVFGVELFQEAKAPTVRRHLHKNPTRQPIRPGTVASTISFLAIIHHGKPTFTLNLVHNPYNQLP